MKRNALHGGSNICAARVPLMGLGPGSFFVNHARINVQTAAIGLDLGSGQTVGLSF